MTIGFPGISTVGSKWAGYDATTIQPKAATPNVYIPGNLTVAGTVTFTGSIATSGQYVTLLDGTAGAPSLDAGFRVDRGTSPYAGIFWDESEEYWRVCTSTDGTLGGTLVDKPIAALAFSASNFFILRYPYGASTGAFYVDGTSVRMAVDTSIQWSSTTDGHAGAKDLGLARVSAGVLKVTDGGAGYGKLVLANGDGSQALTIGTGNYGKAGAGWIGEANQGIYFQSATSASLLSTDATALIVNDGGLVEQRNGANAQTFRIYNTYTDTSNYERGGLYWDSNYFYIATQNAGTGTGRDIIINTASNLYLQTGGVSRWYMAGSHILPFTTAVSDIGSDSKRVRSAYFGGNTVTASTPVINLTQTWNAGAVAFTGIDLNITDTASAAYSFLATFRVGASVVFGVDTDGIVRADGGLHFNCVGYNNDPRVSIFYDSLRLSSEMTLGFTAGSSSNAAPDVGLARASAGVLKVTDGSTGIGFLLVKTPISPKTTDYGVAVNDARRCFTNEGAGALVTFTLPTAAAGLTYTFVVQDGDGVKVLAAAGDTVRLGSSVSAVAGYAQSTDIGSTVTLVAINATEWVATSVVGTWTVT